jgi:hypothetical protein
MLDISLIVHDQPPIVSHPTKAAPAFPSMAVVGPVRIGRPCSGRRRWWRTNVGIAGLMPPRCKCWRKARPSYALSATSSLGRVRGRPHRCGTFTVASVSSASTLSCGCALSRCNPMGRLLLSATLVHFESLPTLVFPLPEPHFSRVRNTCPQTLAPTRSYRGHLTSSKTPAKSGLTSHTRTKRKSVASRLRVSRIRVAHFPERIQFSTCRECR